MSAVVTDKLRILNCSNFINDVKKSIEDPFYTNYYVFVGFPDSSYLYPDWDSDLPSPTDNDLYLNSYRDNILGVKKITSSDVVRVIPKIVWTSGRRYEMYRHDYSVRNLSPVTSSTRLYDSSFYVMNSEYRVYVCINNNSLPSNQNRGDVSTQEPLHTDLAPRLESDGYMWKYLYTISPSDILKFDSTEYISVPNDWETTENSEITRVRNFALANPGRIETIIIENNSSTYPIASGTASNVPIRGDGTGGTATVTFNETGNPVSVTVTNGGTGYTFATLDLESIILPTSGLLTDKAIFNVIIPPEGGHGADVYNELGAFRALVYSRIENNPTNPDFIVGNQFSRIGIIKGVKSYENQELFNQSSGSGVYALKLTDTSNVTEPYDSIIVQDNSNAVGTLVNFDTTTKVLRYIQPRYNNIDTYLVTENSVSKRQIDFNYAKNTSGIQTSINYQFSEFDQNNIKIESSTYEIDTTFPSGGQQSNQITVAETDYYLGQSFSGGLSKPDINIKSGQILYADNRVSVTRSSQQREDIKIILEF